MVDGSTVFELNVAAAMIRVRSANGSSLGNFPTTFASQLRLHTPSVAFRHLPPNSSRSIGYATVAALFISAQLSTDAVSALRKVWVLTIRLEATKRGSTHVNMRRVRPEYKMSSVSFQTISVFICAGVSNVGGYKRNA